MMDRDDWNFRNKLRREIEAAVERGSELVLSGQCKNFDDYAFRTGQIVAYKATLTMMQDAVDTANRSNDATEA